MGNQITIFNNPEFGQVRVTQDNNGEPLFCLKDVCTALNLDGKQVTRRLEKEVVSKHPLQTSGGTQIVTFVNEDGLYDVALDSRKPEAKKFRKWITSDVLPSIRKTGGYIASTPEDTPESIMARAVLIAHATIEKLQGENKELSVKANHLENVVMCNQCYTTTSIAKELGLTAVELNKYLCEQKIQFSQSGQYNLYADFARMGLAKNRTAEKVDENGNLKVFHPYLVWTERGRVFIHNLVRMNPPRLTNKLAIMFVQPTLFT